MYTSLKLISGDMYTLFRPLEFLAGFYYDTPAAQLPTIFPFHLEVHCLLDLIGWAIMLYLTIFRASILLCSFCNIELLPPSLY